MTGQARWFCVFKVSNTRLPLCVISSWKQLLTMTLINICQYCGSSIELHLHILISNMKWFLVQYKCWAIHALQYSGYCFQIRALPLTVTFVSAGSAPELQVFDFRDEATTFTRDSTSRVGCLPPCSPCLAPGGEAKTHNKNGRLNGVH